MNKFPECVWWIGGVVATGIVLLGALRVDVSHIPLDTPFDNTRSGHAEQWRFLDEASELVPAGATVTIHAPDPDTEMSLSMMAVGLLPRAAMIPRAYYGRSVAASAGARFILTFGAGAGESDGPGRSVEITGGTVTDRGSPHP
jgi:hypothetical protein